MYTGAGKQASEVRSGGSGGDRVRRVSLSLSRHSRVPRFSPLSSLLQQQPASTPGLWAVTSPKAALPARQASLEDVPSVCMYRHMEHSAASKRPHGAYTDQLLWSASRSPHCRPNDCPRPAPSPCYNTCAIAHGQVATSVCQSPTKPESGREVQQCLVGRLAYRDMPCATDSAPNV